jgi:hypothetical protein
MGLGKKTVDSDVKGQAKLAAAAALENQEEVNGELVEDGALDDANQEDAELAAAEKALAAAKAKAAAGKKAAAPTKESEIKAVATRETAAPPAVRQAITGMVLESLENKLPALDFGTLARFKASPMGIKGEEGSLGKTCQVTIVSYNNTFAVAPNQDGAPKDMCKFSTDGVNLNDGSGLVADHVAFLKEEGYEKAASKRYVELIAILDDAENDHEEIGNMVTFSLSPMSVKAFERYRLQSTVKLGMNPNLSEESLARVTITAKPKSFGNKDFTMLDFKAAE